MRLTVLSLLMSLGIIGFVLVDQGSSAPTFAAGPTFTVRDVKSAGTLIDSLADADALLGGFDDLNETTLDYSVIDFGPENRDKPFPNGDGDDFAIHATGCFVVRKAGDVTFGVRSDDGSRLKINGGTVVLDDSLHGPKTTVGIINLAKGIHTLDLVYFERGGGAMVELLTVGKNGNGKFLRAAGCPS